MANSCEYHKVQRYANTLEWALKEVHERFQSALAPFNVPPDFAKFLPWLRDTSDSAPPEETIYSDHRVSKKSVIPIADILTSRRANLSRKLPSEHAKTLKLRRKTDSVRKSAYATSNVSDSAKDPEIQQSGTIVATPPGPQFLPTSVAAHGMPPPMDINVNLHNANVSYRSSAAIAMEHESPPPPIIAPQFAQYGSPSLFPDTFNHPADYQRWYEGAPYVYAVPNGISSHVQSQPVQNHLADLDLSETVENNPYLWTT